MLPGQQPPSKLDKPTRDSSPLASLAPKVEPEFRQFTLIFTCNDTSDQPHTLTLWVRARGTPALGLTGSQFETSYGNLTYFKLGAIHENSKPP